MRARNKALLAKRLWWFHHEAGTLWHIGSLRANSRHPLLFGSLLESKTLPETLGKALVRSFISSLFLFVVWLGWEGHFFGRICGWGIDPSTLCFLVFSSYP